MKKLFSLVIFICITMNILFAQYTSGWVNDYFVPFLNYTGAKDTTSAIQQIGTTVYQKSDSSLYIYNGLQWHRMAVGSNADSLGGLPASAYALVASLDYHYNNILTVGSKGAMFTSIQDAVDSINTSLLDSVKISIQDAYFIETKKIILPDISLLIIDGNNNEISTTQDTLFKMQRIITQANNVIISNFQTHSFDEIFVYIGNTGCNLYLNNINALSTTSDYFIYVDSIFSLEVNDVFIQNTMAVTSDYGIYVSPICHNPYQGGCLVNNYRFINLKNRLSHFYNAFLSNVYLESYSTGIYWDFNIDSCNIVSISNLHANTYNNRSEIKLIVHDCDSTAINTSDFYFDQASSDTIDLIWASSIRGSGIAYKIFNSTIFSPLIIPLLGYNNSIYSQLAVTQLYGNHYNSSIEATSIAYINGKIINSTLQADRIYLLDSLYTSTIDSVGYLINNGYIYNSSIWADSIKSDSIGRIFNSHLYINANGGVVQDQILTEDNLYITKNSVKFNQVNIFSSSLKGGNIFIFDSSYIYDSDLHTERYMQFKGKNYIYNSNLWANTPDDFLKGTIFLENDAVQNDSLWLYNSNITAVSSGCPIMVRYGAYVFAENNNVVAGEGAAFCVDGGGGTDASPRSGYPVMISKNNTYTNNSTRYNQAAIMIDYGFQFYSYNDYIYSKSSPGIKVWRSTGDDWTGPCLDSIPSYLEMYNGNVISDSSFALNLLTNKAKIYNSKLMSNGLKIGYHTTIRISAADDGNLTMYNDTVLIKGCQIINNGSQGNSHNIEFIQYSDTNATNKYTRLLDNTFYTFNGQPISFSADFSRDSFHLNLGDRNIFLTSILLDTTNVAHVGKRLNIESTVGKLIPNLHVWDLDVDGVSNTDSLYVSSGAVVAGDLNVIGSISSDTSYTDAGVATDNGYYTYLTSDVTQYAGLYFSGIYAYDETNGTGYDFYIDAGSHLPVLLLYDLSWSIGAVMLPDSFYLGDGSNNLYFGSGDILATGTIEGDSGDFDGMRAGEATINTANISTSNMTDVDISNSFQSDEWNGAYTANSAMKILYDGSGIGQLYSFMIGKQWIGTSISDSALLIDTMGIVHLPIGLITGGYAEIQNHVLKVAAKDDSIVPATANTWYTLPMDTIFCNTPDSATYTAVGDTIFIVNKTGAYQISYDVHWTSNGLSNNTAVYNRILINSGEKRFLNSEELGDYIDGGGIDLFNSVICSDILAGDTIKLQYRSTNTNMEIKGNASVFGARPYAHMQIWYIGK